MTLAALGLLLAAVLLEVLGQTCFKFGTHRTTRTRNGLGRHVFHDGYMNRWIAFGLAAYVVEITLWLAVLSMSQLSQAFPLLAVSYCGVAIASRLIFKERLRPPVVIGIGLISFGAAIILWSS